MKPIKLYGFKYSTNCERVALALAFKKLPTEWVYIDPADRSEIRTLSGQDLVPVIDDGGTIVHDSPEIIRYLDKKYPEPALYPKEPARRAEMETFIDWFNKVWKRPPNDIEAEMKSPVPDKKKIEEWGRWMTEILDRFEAMLDGRDYLMGSAFSAADVIAFPFLRYALFHDPEDTYLFHQILVKYMPLGKKHPRLTAWIQRVDERPRA